MALNLASIACAFVCEAQRHLVVLFSAVRNMHFCPRHAEYYS
jgi:hypothetical protein